jgi:hypothetical protein
LRFETQVGREKTCRVPNAIITDEPPLYATFAEKEKSVGIITEEKRDKSEIISMK